MHFTPHPLSEKLFARTAGAPSVRVDGARTTLKSGLSRQHVFVTSCTLFAYPKIDLLLGKIDLRPGKKLALLQRGQGGP